MKPYEEQTDFEISKRVAELHGDYAILSDDNETLVISKNPFDYTPCPFNPCNSWADIGPIIFEHKIELLYYEDDLIKGWWARYAFNGPFDSDVMDNPCRSAAITFIKMRESD